MRKRLLVTPQVHPAVAVSELVIGQIGAYHCARITWPKIAELPAQLYAALGEVARLYGQIVVRRQIQVIRNRKIETTWLVVP